MSGVTIERIGRRYPDGMDWGSDEDELRGIELATEERRQRLVDDLDHAFWTLRADSRLTWADIAVAIFAFCGLVAVTIALVFLVLSMSSLP